MDNSIFKKFYDKYWLKICKNANNSTSYRVWPHFCMGYNSMIITFSGGPGCQFDQYMKPLLKAS